MKTNVLFEFKKGQSSSKVWYKIFLILPEVLEKYSEDIYFTEDFLKQLYSSCNNKAKIKIFLNDG